MDLPEDFKEFLGLLNAHRVEYVVVGGYATAFHGYPRFTGDLDVLVRPTPANAQRLLKALADFGFGSLDLSEADFLEPRTVVQIGQPPLRIDLITSIDGVGCEDAIEHGVTAEAGDVQVRLISREDLIRNKKASGRPRDKADLEYL